MKQNSDPAERRQHERVHVQTIVVGMLNSGESVTIGSITDISLGGVKFTYHELKMAPDDSPTHSIDIIADNHNLVDIPCKYVWDDTVETESDSKLTDLRQCGIQFSKLTPNQTFLLKSFINHFAPLGINYRTSNVHITFN
jgi:c-di-GMP-binding flagellar brake protein YcgR